ncbi:MAG: DUF1192 domain-containing protein [Alphaproteobacteria bacterium]|nr:DUF1192 domain-containing protein [Alphaproteobacteria bacterium]
MNWDEERPKAPVGPVIGENLEALSVKELEARISLLEEEIKRVGEERERKLNVEAAANQVFKS